MILLDTAVVVIDGMTREQTIVIQRE